MAQSSLKFLADANISNQLVRIVRRLGGGFIESLTSKDEGSVADEVWIPLYAKRGYIAISLDRRQLRSEVIAKAIVSSGARMIYLPGRFADAKRWDQALWLLKRWWAIVERAEQMDSEGEVVIWTWDGRYSTVRKPRDLADSR